MVYFGQIIIMLVFQLCKDRSEVVPVKLPYVYNYLTAELASMNISLSMKLK